MSISERDLALPDVLLIPDIAHYLRISESAAYELAKKPDFPAIRMKRKIRVRREKFLEWLDRQENI